MKTKFDKSNSIKNKKARKKTVTEDFNIRLPDNEIRQRDCDTTDEEEIRAEYERERQQMTKIDHLVKLMGDAKKGKSTWLPDLNDNKRRGSTILDQDQAEGQEIE